MINKTKLSIFIIDDDPEIQALLSKVFRLEGFPVETFFSALDALSRLDHDRKLGTLRVGLILCDLKLPDLGGIEFIEQLTSRKVDIPVVFITSHASIRTAVEALRNGAFDYLLKPINLAELKIVATRAFQLQ